MRLLPIVLLAALVSSCGDSKTYLSKITVTPGFATLNATGQTVQFRAIGTFSANNYSDKTKDITDQVSWSSSTPSVATIDASGVVTSTGNGTTTVFATSKDLGVTGTATLIVQF
jgi:hypothetical protein